MILPWSVLALLFAAIYARMTRNTLLETLGEDYIRTARAKGLSERQVITHHALRASLTPIVTMFGMDIALLVGGAIITESVFNTQGLGWLAIDSDLQPGSAHRGRRRHGRRRRRRDHEPGRRHRVRIPRSQSAVRVSETILDVRDLSVVFPTLDGDVRAVANLSYTLHRGETLGIVGESGSGKTVSSLALMGLLNVDRARISGEALLGGRDLLSLPPDEMRDAARQGHRDDLPGPVRVPPPDASRRRPDRRGGHSAREGLRLGGDEAGRRAAGCRRHSQRRATGRATTRISSRAGCASER